MMSCEMCGGKVTLKVGFDGLAASLHDLRFDDLWWEQAFPLTGFVCLVAHVTFVGGAGKMTSDRPELPYPCFPGQVDT